jgi:hypothetical protein
MSTNRKTFKPANSATNFKSHAPADDIAYQSSHFTAIKLSIISSVNTTILDAFSESNYSTDDTTIITAQPTAKWNTK